MNSLITNGSNSNFYTHLTKLLRECKSYYFSVAFINFSGVQLLLDSLEFCQKNGIKGKILTSTYLNFTQPKALEKLLEYENIELKIYDTNHFQKGFHTKAYIFEFADNYKILLGSSNITAGAFKSNVEWNIKTVPKKDDIFDNQTWNRRYKEYMDKLKTGSLFDVAEVFRDLFLLKLIKDLSFGERKLLDTAKGLLLRELCTAKNADEETVWAEIESLFEAPAEEEAEA